MNEMLNIRKPWEALINTAALQRWREECRKGNPANLLNTAPSKTTRTSRDPVPDKDYTLFPRSLAHFE